jgi:protein ImuB
VPPQPARPEQLALLRGPERIETGWWEPAVTAPSVEPASAEPASADHVQAGWRDYYVARHANGAECWVFVDGLSRWYLHGYFG